MVDGNGLECELVEDTAYAESIVVIDRGTCLFEEKVRHAQNRGAVAVVVADNVDGPLFVMQGQTGNETDINIPAVSVSQSDGVVLKNMLPTSRSILQLSIGKNIIRDSAFDTSIITHEYCHGLSSRLTGGPSNAYCLDPTLQPESGSEGWSDFCALFVTATITTGRTRTIGSFSLWNVSVYRRPLFTANYDTSYTSFPILLKVNGIRAYPYSTDMNINPMTYSFVNYMAGLPAAATTHYVGTIWATMLWEMYWGIVELEETNGSLGFNSDKYQSGIGGSNIAMLLVVEGLKAQACQPTFVDSRNAILIAGKLLFVCAVLFSYRLQHLNCQPDEVLYDSKYKCTIWKSFARRGLGFSAVPSPFGTIGVTESFDAPPDCLGPYASLDDISFAVKSGDGDRFIDDCETAQLTISIKNTGIGGLGNVELVAFASKSTSIVISDLPIMLSPSNLAQGDVGTVTVEFMASGLTHGEPLTFDASFTSDDLDSPVNVPIIIEETATDLEFVDTLTWDFRGEQGSNNWTVIEGLFGKCDDDC